MIKDIIEKIEGELRQTFIEIDTWFTLPENIRMYQPANGGWTINEILEHISLTNHFLLILIEKSTRKALQEAAKANLDEALRNYIFESDKLIQIGLHQSFAWIRPEHMEPKGQKSLDEVRQSLKKQLNQCLDSLASMPQGEGVLYKTTMSVNNLGKIDVYQYIYFLAQHAKRHLTQMQKVANEFRESTKKK